MWQPPNQRRTGPIKRSERARLKLPLHVHRVNAQLVPILPLDTLEVCPLPIEVRAILNDLNEKGIGVFCASPLTIGQDVILNIPKPIQASIKGKIIWCQEHSFDTHVLSNQAYAYRAGIEFTASSEEEKLVITQLCQDIFKNFVLDPKEIA